MVSDLDHRIVEVIDSLSRSTADVRQKFGELSAEQLNWRPEDGGWSIAQCLDHLIKTTEIYSLDIDGIAKGTRASTLLERFSPLSGFFGRFLIKAMANDEKKVKTSDRFVPPSTIDANIVELFAETQEGLKKTVRSTQHIDWEKTILTSSFMSVVTYSLADAYRILTEHQKRHIRQAERVMDTDGFPH